MLRQVIKGSDNRPHENGWSNQRLETSVSLWTSSPMDRPTPLVTWEEKEPTKHPKGNNLPIIELP